MQVDQALLASAEIVQSEEALHRVEACLTTGIKYPENHVHLDQRNGAFHLRHG